MVPDLSTDMNGRKWGVSVDMDIMEDIGVERSNEVAGGVVQAIKARNEGKKVSVD